MKTEHLRAVIVKVTQGDKVVISQAFGESMNGVPATTAMHFRNGAVAFNYLGTLLMKFVDEHKIKLDDTIQRWIPDLPEANKVTLERWRTKPRDIPTSIPDLKFLAAFEADPFRHLHVRRAARDCVSCPTMFEPGTNWSYAHTNFMILSVKFCPKLAGNRWTRFCAEQLGPMGLKKPPQRKLLRSHDLTRVRFERRPAQDSFRRRVH